MADLKKGEAHFPQLPQKKQVQKSAPPPPHKKK